MTSVKNWLLLILSLAVIGLGASLFYLWQLWQQEITTKEYSPTPLSLAPSLQPDSSTHAEPQTTTVLFAGDLMFDRNIRAAARKSTNDFIFAPLKELFLAQDFVIVNLEGPITNNPSRSLGSVVGSPANYSFTFDPSLAKTLYQHNIRVVNLGNNHILNFGQAGLEETLEILDEAQVAFFGYTGTDTRSLNYSHIIDHNDQKIALINYNQFTPGTGSQTAALTEIRRLRPQVDWIVIYTHWDNEYQPTAAPPTVQLAHQFIDAGADLIIGSHPHVIQNHEIYNGKHIYYSLGNFIFDQYFEPAVRNGLMVTVTFQLSPAEIAVKEIPIFLETTGQTTLVK